MKTIRVNAYNPWPNIIGILPRLRFGERCLVSCLIFTLFSSCDKGELGFPFDSAASVNFYLVSDVLKTGYNLNGQRSSLGIFIDGMEQTEAVINTQTVWPQIPFLNSYEAQVSFPYVVVGNITPDEGSPLYMDLSTGEHNFLYAFAGRKYSELPPFFIESLRIHYTLAANGHYCFYFTDAPAENGGEAAYQVIISEQPQEKTVVADKVAVRVMNFSPDAGALKISLQNSNNTGEDAAGLPQRLEYGQVPDYVLLDTLEEQDGMLALNVRDAQSEELLMVTALPVRTGHSFEVLLHGFINPAARNVPLTYDEADGITGYQDISVAPNFRATLRQTF